MSGFTSRLFASGDNALGTDLGLLVLRASVGLAMAFGHGLGKLPPSAGFVSKTGELGFPAPEAFAWLAALSEFGGGLLLAIGLLTRPAASAVLFTMGVAFFLAHAGDAFGDRELSYAYGAAALALLLAGPGRYSLDAVFSRSLRRS